MAGGQGSALGSGSIPDVSALDKFQLFSLSDTCIRLGVLFHYILVYNERKKGGDEMDDIFRGYIIPAIIAAIVALISTIITSLITYRTTKQMIKSENDRLKVSIEASKKESDLQLSAAYISNERVRWIQEVRGTFADFRAHTTVRVNDYTMSKPEKSFSFEINREASYLKLLMKGYGDRELDIKRAIDRVLEIVSCITAKEATPKQYYDAMDALTRFIQIYLKVEWERVKIEIKGEKWNRDVEEKLFKDNEFLYSIGNNEIK